MIDTDIKPVAIIGADLDLSLLHSLSEGDQVLLEMNGARVSSSKEIAKICPLAAEIPWEVIYNSETGISLKHPSIEEELQLSYFDTIQDSPAVFKIINPAYGTSGPIFVIIQFVGHYVSSDSLSFDFPSSYNEQRCKSAFRDEVVRQALLERWEKLLDTFSLNGFGYKSIKRLALRARVSESVLKMIRNGEWENITERQMLSIHEAICWLPHFLRNSTFIQHDPDREYENQDFSGNA